MYIKYGHADDGCSKTETDVRHESTVGKAPERDLMTYDWVTDQVRTEL